MNGPKLSNLNKHTPKNLRLIANIILAVCTVMSSSLLVTQHDVLGVIVACLGAAARTFVELYSEEESCQD